uniref:Uncharacterized protein n=1 Tax=Picea glauca TaxID=3330 RepID=A0A101LV44_PICGL|nr:hypothetical protein ABT39_MTgene2032 [Picea glauca]
MAIPIPPMITPILPMSIPRSRPTIIPKPILLSYCEIIPRLSMVILRPRPMSIPISMLLLS